MSRWVACIAAAAAVAVVWGLLHVGWYTQNQIVDYPVYQTYGGNIVHRHEVPYRDFQLEYPPAALPVFALPSLLDRWNYDDVFDGEMALCLLVLVLAVGAIAGWQAAGLAAVAPLALGSVVISRFDLWPAALAILAVWALLRHRLLVSGLLIGTAFAAKLWPAALVPILGVWLVRELGVRAAARWVAVAVATAAAWFFPFVALSPGGVAHSFHAQLARPLQLESTGSAFLLAAHHWFGTNLQLAYGFGSQNVSGSGVHEVEIATSVLGLLALAAVWVLFAAGPPTVERLLAHLGAAVAALLAFGKVFSPQFMMWLIPFAVIVPGLRGVVAKALLVAGLILTQTWFPSHYWDLANAFAPTQSGELLARDLCVVALFVVLAWPGGLEHEVLGEHRSRLEALQRVRAQVD